MYWKFDFSPDTSAVNGNKSAPYSPWKFPTIRHDMSADVLRVASPQSFDAFVLATIKESIFSLPLFPIHHPSSPLKHYPHISYQAEYNNGKVEHVHMMGNGAPRC